MQQVDNNEFAVLHVNIRSLIKNLDKLKELINAMKMTPDIIAISETWLEPSIPDKICLDSYLSYTLLLRTILKKIKALLVEWAVMLKVIFNTLNSIKI